MVLFLGGSVDPYTNTGCIGAKEYKPNARITYINGINNKSESIAAATMKISSLHKFNKVHYVCDSTKGLIYDLMEACYLLTTTKLTPSANQLKNLWIKLFKEMEESNNPNCYIVHYAHSRGGLVTNVALKNLPPELRTKMIVYTLGSPVISSETDARIIKNISNTQDIVPLTNPMRWKKVCGHELEQEVLIPSSGTKLIDHGIIDETYLNQLGELAEYFSAGGYDSLNSESPEKPQIQIMQK